MREDTATNPASRATPALVRLPPRPTRLIGRGRETAAVCDLLLRDDIRLVTITGPPGVGKTRLAVEVAALVAGRFPDGVAFVDLSGTREAAIVPYVLAEQLGMQEIGEHYAGEARSIVSRLIEFLSQKAVLIALDNFEQVVSAAPVVGELLAECVNLKIITTSRIPLQLLWEHEFPVAPLAVTDHSQRPWEGPAVRLFAERARAHRPDFTLSEDTASTVAKICMRVDGLPLAIELAAAHIGHLPLATLLEKVEHRLQLLAEGPRDLPDRHRTLRAAIAWSYDLLTPDEQALFRRLCVFAGGFTLEAAATVRMETVSDIFLGISGLIDRQLVRQVGAGPSPRFDILESLREFGLEQLGAEERTQIHRRHFAFFLSLAGHDLADPEQLKLLASLDAEQDNLRTALTWAADQQDSESVLRMAVALRPYWSLRARYQEGQSWLDRGLANSGEISGSLRARVLSAKGWLLLEAGGNVDLVGALFDESLALASQQADEAATAEALHGQLRVVGVLGGGVGEHESRETVDRLRALSGSGTRPSQAEVDRLRQECLHRYQGLGNKHGTATILGRWAWSLAARGQLDQAEQFLEEAFSLGQQIGDRRVLATVCNGRGLVAIRRGDLERAIRFFEQRLALSRELTSAWDIYSSINNLGVTAMEKGDYATARARLNEALTFAQQAAVQRLHATLEGLGYIEELEGQYHMAAVRYREYLIGLAEMGVTEGLPRLGMAAGVAAGLGWADIAARLLGAAEALREALARRISDESDRRLQERRFALIRRTLSEEQLAAARAAGRAMPVEEALKEALKVLDDAISKGDTSAAPARRPGPLSRREAEVAGLVAQGLSNRAIARRLFISERTADTHVQHILNKLGFNSRTQIAAWATQQGLTAPASNS